MDHLALLLVHLAATLFMCGLIWTIQVVHYPIFDRIAADGFAEFSKVHAGRISAVLAVPWGLEVLTTLALVVSPPPGVAGWLPWSGLILTAGIIAITAEVSAPLHSRLSNGFDAGLHRALVGTNWFRTALWSTRGILAVLAVWQFSEIRA